MTRLFGFDFLVANGMGGSQTPIEKAMADLLSGSVPAGVTWAAEVPIGDYRADFVITAGETRVVVECDGADFHEFWRDRKRDVRMLLDHGITAVARFRGCDLVYEPAGCLRWLKTFFPHLFDVDASPLSVADMALASVGLKAVGIQPIVRIISPTSEVPTPFDGYPAACVHVSCSGPVSIVQFKSPYWRVPA